MSTTRIIFQTWVKKILQTVLQYPPGCVHMSCPHFFTQRSANLSMSVCSTAVKFPWKALKSHFSKPLMSAFMQAPKAGWTNLVCWCLITTVRNLARFAFVSTHFFKLCMREIRFNWYSPLHVKSFNAFNLYKHALCVIVIYRYKYVCTYENKLWEMIPSIFHQTFEPGGFKRFHGAWNLSFATIK